MPEIQIRPVLPGDIAELIELDHSYSSDLVWQMDFKHDRLHGQINIAFRKVNLPRSVRHEVPRPPRTLADDWQRFSGMLVAAIEEQPVGYISILLDPITRAAWIPDLLVNRPLRRQGIGSALLLSAADWATTKDSRDMVLEIQPRNGPAIEMALKLGFEFCGYNDFYYPVNEIGLFFRKSF